MDLGFGAASSDMETAGEVAFPVIDFVGGAVAPFVQGIGETITDPFMPDNDTTSVNLPSAPKIETVEGADAPNIVTVNPYSTDTPTKAIDFTMGSGSLGFIRPEDKEKENIYTSTQENV